MSMKMTITSTKLSSCESIILYPRSTYITSFQTSSSVTFTTYQRSSSLSILHSTHSYLPTLVRSHSHSSTESNNEEPDQVEELRVPEPWLFPTTALQESEWLRVSLHKWLDDEYCPEETNVEISKVAAKSYYNSLLKNQKDLGTILLNMAHELESISYKESFHGAFSAANAAVNLIAQRIEQFTS
ncbi:hypothetical protein TanjilG_06257 [Lupinus angustifolius]|uniref:Uncharacterized protein n=1 Tax=Lupinus angustifolius TaxID=3871 RepID=A0A1J7H0Q4_LUPAN|nr:PREDICTED: uncharacterized protein LOC109329018 [Lupinus angustifolius]OIV95388.1 hypothetical protein TanjilG_06257 [Lupinus angustifolius]